jgi:hypothetical protein
MIISLFMDETPLIGGSGHNSGVRTDGPPRGPRPGDGPPRRDEAQDEHEQAAGDDHVSALSGKGAAFAKATAGKLAGGALQP